MPCENCGRAKVVLRGLCRPCYGRLVRTGSLAVTPKSKDKRFCSMDGCAELHVARGLCEAHYRIAKRYGDVISPFGYGDRQKHQNYGAWCYQIRVKEGRVPAWDDFWQFVGDVGDKPSEKHVARRLDETKPWGPDNFRWLATRPSGIDAKEWARENRARNPMRHKGYSLRRAYGISIEEYSSMYEAQEGRCAICRKAGEPFNSANGRNETLVVDHHHGVKKCRALLCPACNKALGGFRDSVAILQAAIAYLKKYS